MSKKELYDAQRTSKYLMWKARNKQDRGAWMLMYRWASEEIKRATAGATVVTQE